jgi:hypothetical protein
MIYTFIDTILPGYTLNLEVLRPNTHPYNVLLFQNKGVFDVGDDFFGNEGDESAKFNSFFNLARDENAELIVTPEYSCPWESICNILDDSVNFPALNKLWVLGCESITPDAFFAFRDKYNNQNNIEIHFDEIDFNAGGVLLDPCCYIFKALSPEGVEKLIVLIQFKIQHMGVWGGDAEQVKYIPGRTVYILKNNPDSISLFTIICSDAISFNGDDITNQHPGLWENLPYLIISIQMNSNPSHESFKSFRRAILASSNNEIITLNWSSESTATFNQNFFNRYSKSNISIKTNEIDYNNPPEQAVLRSNHHKGMYYTLMKPNRHCFFLNPGVEIISYQINKVFAGNVNPVLVRRSGPTINEIYEWANQNNEFIPIPLIGDGYVDFISSLNINCNNLNLSDSDLCFIDKERLINLSLGEFNEKNGGENWHHIDRLHSFLMDDSESINRYTVTFDDSANVFRQTQLHKFEELNEIILKNEINFPDILSSFKNNCEDIMFYNNGHFIYKYNLVTSDNQNKATVVYLGRVSESQAEEMRSKVLKLFPEEDRIFKQIVIWFKSAPDNYSSKPTEVPKITNTNPNNFTSITESQS